MQKDHRSGGLYRTRLLRPARSTPMRTSGFYIVFVEDNTAIRLQTREICGQWRTAPRLKFVGNGFEALIELTVEVPDLLIAKIGVPHLSGISMLQCIRNVPEYAQLPVVLVAEDRREEALAKELQQDNLTVLPRRGMFDGLEPIVETLFMSKAGGAGAADAAIQ